jgi:transcriptional regulator with XRE-family HTH domain
MTDSKRYASVSEMLRESMPDEFRKEFEARRASRKVIKHMMALRAVRGVSQQDIAAKMGCSQSRVSKLENGVDDDMRIGDLKAYMRALECSVGFVFSKANSTLADEVKHHAFRIKHLLEKMADLAGGDEKIARGVSGFFGEAFLNVVSMIQDCASKLPAPPNGGPSYIRIEVEMDGPDEICDEDDEEQSKDCPSQHSQSEDSASR